MTNLLPLNRIVSGGQTGVDRGALEAAIGAGIDHGGWCPRGRLAEDGVIDERYRLEETDSPQYEVRTERNVVDSDATLILHRGELSGGTLLTKRMAEKHNKPLRLVDVSADPDPEATRHWLTEEAIATLNVAGPRESGAPGIQQEAEAFLQAVFQNP